MTFLFGLFGSNRQQRGARHRAPAAAPLDPQPQLDATRRQLVTMAVGDTLRTHGIPAEWLEVTALPTSGRQRGMQVSLAMKQWQPALLQYAMALQRGILARLLRLDPLASQWLRGVTWRFEDLGPASCRPLPPPGYWHGLVAEPPPAGQQEQAPAGQQEQAPAGQQVQAPGRNGLHRLLAAGDGVFAEGAREKPDFAPTQPIAIG